MQRRFVGFHHASDFELSSHIRSMTSTGTWNDVVARRMIIWFMIPDGLKQYAALTEAQHGRTTIEIQLENDEIATIIVRHDIDEYMNRGDDLMMLAATGLPMPDAYIGGDDWFVSSNPHVAA